MVTADVQWLDHTDVVASPRQILRRQIKRLEEAGMKAFVGTELEFIVFNNTYEDAWNKRYRGLTPANQYNVDYSILGGSRIEPLLRAIRLGMAGAGMYVESVKGECNFGQHEIAFLYADALTTCDNHVVYKTGAKEIAAQEGYALTFMAKWNEREGNSCHTHLSFRGLDGSMVFADESDVENGLSAVGRSFIAGQLEHMRELSLLFAPNINSYKRFALGSFAPTAMIQEGVLAKYQPDLVKDWPAELKDKNGYWTAHRLTVITPGYNTNLVKPADVPKTWNDFLDPKWKGKMAWGINPGITAATGFSGLVLREWGEEKGMAYLRELATVGRISSTGATSNPWLGLFMAAPQRRASGHDMRPLSEPDAIDPPAPP